MKISGQVKHEIVILKQQAHRVWGTINYPEDTQGRSHTYQLEGLLFDNVLTALTEETGKARLDRGALVLTIRPGLSASVMKGLGIWFEGPEPLAVEYTWYSETP